MSRSEFQELSMNLNVNDANGVTDSIDLRDNRFLCVNVEDTEPDPAKPDVHPHATHIITIQCSSDDAHWYDTAHVINQKGIKDNMEFTSRYARARTSTVEGSASTCKVIFQAK